MLDFEHTCSSLPNFLRPLQASDFEIVFCECEFTGRDEVVALIWLNIHFIPDYDGEFHDYGAQMPW